MITRRTLLRESGMGMGALALADVLAQAAPNPLDPRAPHFRGRAKRVIHLFANGGPSHIDTFDPKPALQKYVGGKLPFEKPQTERKTGGAFPSPFKFQRCGRSGIEVSELFPSVGAHIDRICVIRSMVADLPNHDTSMLLMNCGDNRLSRPSLGSWVTYGLGTENQNLPGFIVMCPTGLPVSESQNWQSAFLPGVYQGTYIDSQYTEVDRLIENVKNESLSLADQRRELDLLGALNREHEKGASARQHNPLFEARVQSFELAYRMQMEASDAFSLDKEPKHILDLYGPGLQARQLIIARRLLERGVRFVQVYTDGGNPWDSHENLVGNHRALAKDSDQAIAALLEDLRQRGMLDDTLVIWGGEFGRTPVTEGSDGRDHNPHGFTVWLAGAGVRGGHVHGATDELGWKAADRPVHVHDLHATILHLLGFDHEKLTYRYAGRDFRLTDVSGKVVKDILT